MAYAILAAIIVLLSLALVIVIQMLLVQRATIFSVRNLIDHLLHGRQVRRVHEGVPGPVKELAHGINLLAADLEQKTTQAQQDQDHLLALLKLLDHTDEFAIATDSLDVVRLINPAAARVLGKPADSLLGRPIDEVLIQPELLALYRKAFTAETPVAAEIAITSPSRTLACQATAATIYSGPHYRGSLLLMRDITEIVRTLQIKTDFVANASHELRTPLASIRAAVETIEEGGLDDTPTVRRCVGIIGNHALRLQMLVQDLLDLSRTEDPRAVVRFDELDLAEICHTITTMYALQAEAKTIAVRTDLAPDAQRMLGDVRLVQLLLKNLVDNAIKFTPQGSVTIRAYRTDKSLVLQVTDTGIGIGREDQERVFERFYTVNQSRGGADRGTGLGLAIVKHAVMHMGGTVELESELGKGTTVRCAFPLAAAVSPPEPELTSLEPKT